MTGLWKHQFVLKFLSLFDWILYVKVTESAFASRLRHANFLTLVAK